LTSAETVAAAGEAGQGEGGRGFSAFRRTLGERLGGHRKTGTRLFLELRTRLRFLGVAAQGNTFNLSLRLIAEHYKLTLVLELLRRRVYFDKSMFSRICITFAILTTFHCFALWRKHHPPSGERK
jgi:hypothetical protein